MIPTLFDQAFNAKKTAAAAMWPTVRHLWPLPPMVAAPVLPLHRAARSPLSMTNWRPAESRPPTLAIVDAHLRPGPAALRARHRDRSRKTPKPGRPNVGLRAGSAPAPPAHLPKCHKSVPPVSAIGVGNVAANSAAGASEAAPRRFGEIRHGSAATHHDDVQRHGVKPVA